MTTESPLRSPRGRRGAASVLTAVLLLAVAAATGYLVVMAALNRPVGVVDVRPLLDRVRTTTYESSAALWLGVGLGALGLAALLAAVVPPSRRVEELVAPDADTATAITRRGLRRTLAAAAVDIDGISHATARVGGRRVRLEATSPLRRLDGLQDAASSAARRRLQQLELRRHRTLTTRLHQKES